MRTLQQVILADKAQLTTRLDRLLAFPPRADQQTELRAFLAALGVHHLAIEEVLYPALAASAAPDDDLAMAQASHELCEHCANEALAAAGTRLSVVRPHLLALRSLWRQWPAGREATSLQLAEDRLPQTTLTRLAIAYRSRVVELSIELGHNA